MRYSYLSILPDDNTDTFAACVLMSYCSVSSLLLSSIIMIDFYILSKRSFLKHQGSSDGRLPSIIRKEHAFAVHF